MFVLVLAICLPERETPRWVCHQLSAAGAANYYKINFLPVKSKGENFLCVVDEWISNNIFSFLSTTRMSYAILLLFCTVLNEESGFQTSYFFLFCITFLIFIIILKSMIITRKLFLKGPIIRFVWTSHTDRIFFDDVRFFFLSTHTFFTSLHTNSSLTPRYLSLLFLWSYFCDFHPFSE